MEHDIHLALEVISSPLQEENVALLWVEIDFFKYTEFNSFLIHHQHLFQTCSFKGLKCSSYKIQWTVFSSYSELVPELLVKVWKNTSHSENKFFMHSVWNLLTAAGSDIITITCCHHAVKMTQKNSITTKINNKEGNSPLQN